MKPFVPKLVYFEPDALDYPLGQTLYDKFKDMDLDIRYTTSHNQVRNLPGESDLQKYRVAKSTLVVGIRKTLKFDTSKPSAEYAIPFATGCMGHCHYCYLQTTMGSKPYIRTYVNVEEILDAADRYMAKRAPEYTRFEASCTSDIVGIDHLTHTLRRAIEHFGQSEYGKLRFVTKFHHVDHLLDARHNGKTRFRFSVNADYIIKNFEPGTSPLEQRIEAAGKVARGRISAWLYRRAHLHSRRMGGRVPPYVRTAGCRTAGRGERGPYVRIHSAPLHETGQTGDREKLPDDQAGTG
ncbi:hypothetical protein HMSSN036_84720 [Paenibacillus macerans]|nr:hypothetical protein HMSSN036_84720 [Paenibacillus macerans]